jgi:hypothetical protein
MCSPEWWFGQYFSHKVGILPDTAGPSPRAERFYTGALTRFKHKTEKSEVFCGFQGDLMINGIIPVKNRPRLGTIT